MKKSILRVTAWLMALFVAISSLGGITTVSAVEETVLELTADMAENRIITVKGGSWDKIVVPRTTGAKRIRLNGVTAGGLVIESGTDCVVEISGGEIAAATVTPPQLEVIGYEEITKMLEEGMPAGEVAELYRSYLEEKEYLSELLPTLVTKGEADIKAVQVSGNVKLELGEGNVGGVKIDADGVQELLNVRIAGYGGKVDVEQKELPDGVWNVMKLALDNSDLAELNIAGAKSSACHVEGWKSSVGKVELAGQTSLTMNVKAEEVRLGSKAENAFLKVYSAVGSITVEGDKNSVSLAASAKVEKAEVKGDNVKVYGSGQLGEADITGSGANVSTAGTKVEGENNSTPPAGSIPSSPSTPVRPVVTPTPKPEITPTGTPETTPTPKPTGTPEVTPTPKPTGTPEEPEVPETDASLFTYEINTDGTITVTGMVDGGWGYLYDWDAGTCFLSIPRLIDGKQVTAIGEYAFGGIFRDEGNSIKFLNLVLPEGLVAIGDEAFSCIGVWGDWGAVIHVKLPSTLKTIGNYAFRNVRLETVLIPAGVEDIFYGAFSGTKKSIEVEKGNRYYTSVDGVLFNKAKTRLMQMPSEVNGSYSIPDTVREIGYYAFYHSQLSSIIIPEGVRYIRGRAFDYADQLESLVIPSTVTHIADDAFNMCSALSSIEVAAGNADYTSEDGTLYNKDKTVLCKAANKDEADFVILESVTKIISGAFSGCTDIKSIIIPDGISAIDGGLFYRCTGLESVTIPESVAEIGGSAFYDCRNLKSITIPESVTRIEAETFSHCTSLESITIPDSVTEIGGGAFYDCRNLKSITIPESVTRIEAGTFSHCTSLESITISGSITAIGSNAFSGCGIESITIPEGVTEIGPFTFSGCTSLESITIPDSVTEIGYRAFDWCTSLESITIPDSVTKIESSAFCACRSLEFITIPKSVTTIGEEAFEYCPSLTIIADRDSYATWYAEENNIPLKLIGSETISPSDIFTFVKEYNGTITITGLKEGAEVSLNPLTIPAQFSYVPAKTIGGGAFTGNEALLSVNITSGIEAIGANAFTNCNMLESIEIPDSVTEIGNSAFSGCTSLKSIEIPDSVTKIYNSSFDGCTSLEFITIPKSVTKIERLAFAGCPSLTIIAYADSYAAQYAKENNIPLKLIGSETISPSDIFTFVQRYGSAITITGLKEGAEVSLNPLTIPAQFSHVPVKYIGSISLDALEFISTTFKENEALLGVNIASGIEAIGANVFENCSMLTFVDIPATVKNIDSNAFANIGNKATGNESDDTPSASGSALTVTVIIRGDDVQISGTAFRGIPNILFQVQEGSKVEAFLRKQGFSDIEYLPEE